MKNLIRLLLTAAFAATLVASACADLNWYSSWSKAAGVAKQSGRPLMVVFTGSDWCQPCHIEEHDIFESAVFQAWAKQHVVLLKLDFPRRHPQPEAVKEANTTIAQKYAISGFPTVLFATPDGKVLGSQSGYEPVGPTMWTKNAEYMMQVGRQRLGSR